MSEFQTALATLRAERQKLQKKIEALDRAIAALSEDGVAAIPVPGRKKADGAARPARRKRRPFSEATKAKMREAQQRRREQEKAGQSTTTG